VKPTCSSTGRRGRSREGIKTTGSNAVLPPVRVASPDVWAFEQVVDTNDHRMVSIGFAEIIEKGDQSRWPRI
jgi:hypothetical protein